MKRVLSTLALLVTGSATCVASVLVLEESHRNHEAPETVANSGKVSLAVIATGPFGLLFVCARRAYYALHNR
jgi:hypothetical protein